MYRTSHGENLLDSQVLWRYMSFAKFSNLVLKGRLYFCRLDRLQQTDPHEYSNTSPIFALSNPELYPEGQRAEMRKFNEHFLDQEKRSAAAQAVCCWRADTNESHAMWQIYTTSFEGVAIRTTLGRLKRALVDKRDVDIGPVSYYESSDNNPTRVSEVGPFRVSGAEQTNVDRCLHKQPWYIYESEVRAMLINPHYPQAFEDAQLYVDVDLDILLGSVVVHPDAAPWFRETVEDVIGVYEDRVKQSEMARGPKK